MRMLQSILLAVDFRPASLAAQAAALQLASTFGSHVTLLHVLAPPPPGWPATLHQEQKEAAGPLTQLAQKLADQHVQIADSAVVVGPPADTIVRKAHEIDADLILIGAGERSRVESFCAGPVAQAVIEHALQPVLAVRPGEPTATFQTILCPVDQSGASARGLSNAIRLAQVFGSKLIVLSVVPEVTWLTAAAETGYLAGARAEFESKWRQEFDQFLAAIPPDVKLRKEVRQGIVPQQILAAAQDHQADVIIMGATGRTGLVRMLLGSTTRRLLQQLPCSLLTLKEEDVVEELFTSDIRTINLLLAEARELMIPNCYELALTKFRQVLAINPFHVAATEGLAEVYEKLGHSEEAQFYRRRALGLKDDKVTR